MRALLIGLAALTTGCGLSCTAMYAPSSTYVYVDGDDAPGRYQLEGRVVYLEVEGAHSHFVRTLPRASREDVEILYPDVPDLSA